MTLRTTAKQRGRGSGGASGCGFKPGQSGNPGGRAPIIQEIRDLARAQTAAAISTLVAIMRRGTTDASRVSAAVALLDRGWGRPVQALEANVRVEDPNDLSKLTDAELAQLEALLTKAARVPQAEPHGA